MYSCPKRPIRLALLLFTLTNLFLLVGPADAAVLEYNRQYAWVLTDGTPFEEPELNPHVPTDSEDVKHDDDGREHVDDDQRSHSRDGRRVITEDDMSPLAKWIRKVVGFRIALPGASR